MVSDEAGDAISPSRVTTTPSLISTALGVSYNCQALVQERAFFWASLCAGCITFGLGIGLILYVLLTGGLSWQVTIVETLLGVTLKAVSVLFFRQMSEARNRSTALYDRIRIDQNVSQAIQIADSIDNLNVRSNTKAKLALSLATGRIDEERTRVMKRSNALRSL